MHEAILGAHAIDDQLPVEVIELVLPHTGGKSITLKGETLAVEIGGGDPGEPGTPDGDSDLGMLKQPSSKSSRSPPSSTSGFTKTRGSGSGESRGSATKSRMEWPTCGAASPTPSAAYIVSIIRAARFRRSSSTASTSRALAASTGWGYRMIWSGVLVTADGIVVEPGILTRFSVH